MTDEIIYNSPPYLSDDWGNDMGVKSPPDLGGIRFSGLVIDADTKEPIPGASVQFYLGQTLLDGMAANGQGQFNTVLLDDPDGLVITHAEYNGSMFQAANGGIYSLERKVKALEDVIVTSSGKGNNNWLLFGGLGLLLLLSQKKKKVGSAGELNMNTLLVVGGGIFAVSTVMNAGKGILTTLGMYGGPGIKAAEAEQINPNSPWKPAFWKVNVNRLLITDAKVTEFIKTIHDAFTLFQDDFNAIMGVFSQLKTKSQVSYLSDKFTQRYNEDLLSFLKDGGGLMPWDGLSDKNLKILLDMVNGLPQYLA